MRIAYITAGAAGMYCGSCMHDNTLAAALIAQGHDALLIPTYTPIRVDEQDVSQERVFFGGINVYLQQKSALFRHTPWGLDRLLDARWLLRWVSRFAVSTEAASLGELTLSILKGEHGYQRKEVEKLADWLRQDVKPDIVHLTNVILSGMVHKIKERVRVPVLGELQGDDIYLESLPPRYKEQALALIREHCRELDGFVSPSAAYADFMADYLAIPRAKIHVVPLGLSLKGHGGPHLERAGEPFTIGYFARICPEKGLHVLVDAYCRLRQTPGLPPSRLRIAGWLGEHNRAYFEEQVRKLTACGLAGDFEHIDCPDHASKVYFLQGLDVLSVPTVYREPKGLYVLEAWANGVPVVQPRHGSFPELLAATGGGMLVNPEDPADLARGLRELLEDRGRCQELGAQGQKAVRREFTAEVMARNTVAVYEGYVGAEERVRKPVMSGHAKATVSSSQFWLWVLLCIPLVLGGGLLVGKYIGDHGQTERMPWETTDEDRSLLPNDRPVHIFEGSSEGLTATAILPTLDTPIPAGKSAIWCVSFQLAWNRLKTDAAQGPIKLRNATAVAERLNRAQPSEADLLPKDYFSTAGFVKDDIVNRIRNGMREKFPEAPVPNLAASPGGAVAFAYLRVKAAFETPFFDNEQRLIFTDGADKQTAIRSFGIRDKDQFAYERLRRQVRILYRTDRELANDTQEFIIDPSQYTTPYQVVLARVQRGMTLADILTAVEERIARGAKDQFYQRLGPIDTLLIPNMQWRVEHRFGELEGPDKVFENPALAGLYLDTASQMIQFKLDRGGAELISEAKIEAKPEATNYAFNRPFLLYLKKRDAQQPFFVMWVDNAELLQPR